MMLQGTPQAYGRRGAVMFLSALILPALACAICTENAAGEIRPVLLSAQRHQLLTPIV
jgi:hypothetical protein